MADHGSYTGVSNQGFGITGSWRFCVWVTNVAVARQFNHNHPSGRDKELRIRRARGGSEASRFQPHPCSW